MAKALEKADVAIVTGAGGALGGAVARVLYERGKRLVLVDGGHRGSRVPELAAELGGACVVTGDLATAATWGDALPRIEKEVGSAPTLAALIAGTWRGGKPLHEETDDANWETLMRDNLETVYRGFRALLPPMVARGRGSIVVVGSRAAEAPAASARAAAYAASKAAVVALSQAVAAEVREQGVRVNAILPSTLDTPANRAAMPKADASRWVSPSSAAEVVAFLLSDEARDISGAAVPVYGGA
jgi:NAD(P)-dependent dehydrogenase (short-subunit alcohol dehydrogenase family)